MKKILLSIIIFTSFSLVVKAQNRIYVNSTSTGGNNGTSWLDAFTDLQTALQSAQAGDEIWVKEGTYLPTADNNRDTSFTLRSGTKLYGGFAGSETTLEQRNWLAHPTVLSGDIGVIGDSTDNSYTILFMDNPDSLTVVDGLIFRFGNAGYTANDQAASSRYRSGGAIYILANWEAFATVSNCRFERNNARNHGGAVYVHGAGSFAAAPTLRGCIFEFNTAGQDGGGVARIGDSDLERPDFEGCKFKENKAGRFGGGLYFQGANVDSWVDVQGCSFVKNQSLNRGAGAVLRIGRPTGAKARVIGCHFEKNEVSSALLILPLSGQLCQEVLIRSSTFVNSPANEIEYDLIGTPSSIMRITECRFEDHSSSPIVVVGDIIANLIFEKDTFFNVLNTQITTANGENKTQFCKTICKNIQNLGSFRSDSSLFLNLLIQDSNFPFGIALSEEVGHPLQFSSCDFIECKLNYLAVSASDAGISAGFNNCLFSNSSVSYSNANLNDIVITLNDCFLADSTFCVNTDTIKRYQVTCGPNNLFNLDPQFRDTANHDYSLLPCSPLINAGSNLAAAGILTDLAGNPRIQDGVVDIGAYEAPAFSLGSASTIKPACMGSSNGSILLQPVFGCEPYDYQWFPAAGDGPELTGLPPGAYQLTLTDGSGRKILDTLLVDLAPNPDLAALSTDVQCGNPLGGTITAGIGNGTAPYHYIWQPAAADTAYLSHLSPGSYALTVTDANGCQDSASTHIALQGMITLMIGGQSISCFGETDGWLSATPATGAAPFEWLWTGWTGTDSLAQPLGPGNYSVTVSDRYGCTASNTFPTMNAPDSLVIGTGTSPQTQNNPPNGAAVVTTVSGGTSPFDYFWETGGTDQSIAGLTAGLYTLTVTDDRGCTASATVEVKLMVGTEDPAMRALLIYPNPAVDWVEVVLPARLGLAAGVAPQRVELSDESGRVLRSAELDKGSGAGVLDLRGLPSGMYWVHGRNVAGLELFVGKVMKR